MTTLNSVDLTLDRAIPGTYLPDLAQAPLLPLRPNLNTALHSCAPLPHSALFLGLADDGLPILLNLRDPFPGPILIAADASAGKTLLLRVIARAVNFSHAPEQVRFAVITASENEWDSRDRSANCDGIMRFNQIHTVNYATSLVRRAYSHDQTPGSLVLLIDGFCDLAGDHSLHEALRWLLLLGPSRRIWPMITLRPCDATAVEGWLGYFRTCLFGHMQHACGLHSIDSSLAGALGNLSSGSQFALRAGSAWLPFWLPELD